MLANEQVVNGRGWRSGAVVEQIELAQWFLRITDYAEELSDSLDKILHWPENLKKMQFNWIGKSGGLEIVFRIKDAETHISIFTTKPETIYGVTYVAISLDHPLALQEAKHDVVIAEFLKQQNLCDVSEETLATRPLAGIKTSLHVVHPLTGEILPVYLSNAVKSNYATGAIMAVPGHNSLDQSFAELFTLPSISVINSMNLLCNSKDYDGMQIEAARNAISEALITQKIGNPKTYYRLRDWGISRQRAWGAPIPMVICDICGYLPVNEQDLPVTSTLTPVNCPKCLKLASREQDTFDTFMESSWYYARYISACAADMMFTQDTNHWLPVDLYIGGIEHDNLHFLYARYFHKQMRDFGMLPFDEPFDRVLTQGMVLKDGTKMSKSKGNTVSPIDMLKSYGADALRMFISFAAPPDMLFEWSTTGILGPYRFLQKLWIFAQTLVDVKVDEYSTAQARHLLQDEIGTVTHALEQLKLNLLVSSSMKIFNLLQRVAHDVQVEGLKILLKIMHPVAPHITQYLWQYLKFGDNILHTDYPCITTYIRPESFNLIVQVNGKKKAIILASCTATVEELMTLVLARLPEQKYHKYIYLPYKLINLIT